ncbi:hypothetical protein GRI38_03665 [Altererythrobacter aurantiacus]|uniref:Uncharacterized protein n=1 Tax=Parapontixanthobacter aurantiacus TaxID=1463599 RepID=A0A844ZD50_9SPHN|nr:hypothetical protein [Parapontixanthobacter aurantiacus]MXO85123.1 hypothetical protein [Parapontixanthobacter aurantiacus]
MLKRLLTCLALLTGLAAIGIPAQAFSVAAMAAEVDGRDKASETPADVECEVLAPRGWQRKDVKRIRCKPVASTTIFLPTVQMGIDRAYE